MISEGRGQPSTQVDIMFHVSQHSLVVAMTRHLRWLGLRSLKEVSAGKVMLKDNPQLCYTQPFQWTRLFRSADQTATIRNNRPVHICGECVFVGLMVVRHAIRKADCVADTEQQQQTCDRECTDMGCWGPGPDMCVSCRHFSRRGHCVQLCNVLYGWALPCPLNFTVPELFLQVRQTCFTWPVPVCSEPREAELNGSCVSCHSECQLQTGIPACHGPVGSIITDLITGLSQTN